MTCQGICHWLAPFKNGEYDKVGLERFELLISGRSYKRVPINRKISLTLNNKSEAFEIYEHKDKKIKAQGFLKEYQHKGQRYVKIIVKNTSKNIPKNKFSFRKEELNERTFFQVKIDVKAELLPYRTYLGQYDFDEEAQLIDFQYQDVQNFGIGHGCAVEWDAAQQPLWIATTYMPEIEIPSVTNKFRAENQHLEDVACLRNLSIWTDWDKETIIERLRTFVDSYGIWITQEETGHSKYNQNSKVTNKIIGKQQENLNRLYEGVDLLDNNEDVFKCFVLANTAMLIQMIISTDRRFSKTEKEWGEIDVLLQQGKDLSYEDGRLSYKDLEFFKEYSEINAYKQKWRERQSPIAYRPFQLAFLLLSLESTINPSSTRRNEIVDLIWFPTGGGKTEAYLVLTAFTILWRRLQNPKNYSGVSVIMRYTLRLLTVQQFERAGRLIVALEFLRKTYKEGIMDIGNEPITIGMWVGTASTPNTLEDAKKKIGEGLDDEKTISKQVRKLNEDLKKDHKIERSDKAYDYSPFQISACPWCGCKLITKKNGEFIHGFRADKKQFKLACNNSSCAFNAQIPVDVVDESLYRYPPTLLFATVDKFARLAHEEDGNKFFNSQSQGLPPDLIIQDELHLLNGPLGSIVGLYEMIVERLCTKGSQKPKIIASTATTRNTEVQIKSLYGGRNVNIFPPQGLSAKDNFFSKTETEKRGSLRKHIGIMPTGKTMIQTQVDVVLPNLLLARVLLKDTDTVSEDDFSDYWTIVSYYNSLKSVGKIYNKVGDEVFNILRQWHNRLKLENKSYNFLGLSSRTKELTSRIDSSKIKATLKELEKDFSLTENDKYVGETVDLVLASNMFSVGIDIGRLNVMLMNGQTKNIAEYIQASSRVARQRAGLVVNLLDGNLSREKSYFENYLPFHQAYYRFVEPLTVTPFTEITFEKVLNSILITYVRHIKGIKDATDFDGDITELLELIKQRLPNEQALQEYAIKLLTKLAQYWYKKADGLKLKSQILKYKPGLIEDDSKIGESDWAIMNSLREVDNTSLIALKIKHQIKDYATTTDAEQE
jgi:hypothetical protein